MEPLNKLISLCETPLAHHKKIQLKFCNIQHQTSGALGICWNTEPLPTPFNKFQLFDPSKKTIDFELNNLTPNTDYYFRVFFLSDQGVAEYLIDITVSTLPELKIGDYYQGGIIAYLFKPRDSLYIAGEQHGLIISVDELGFANWGMYGKAVEGGTSIRVGYGALNTANILNFFGQGAAHAHNNSTNSDALRIIHPYAAALCASYKKEGWDDWFLPSKEDWNIIFGNIDSLEVAQIKFGESYWSSSEVFISWGLKKGKSKPTKSQFKRAWQVQFNSKIVQTSSMSRKNSAARVRAMRYF